MTPISTALIHAIVHIESRDVPDDIADDDVAALEQIMATLADLDDSDRQDFLKLLEKTRAIETDIRKCEALDSLHEMLSDG